MALLKTYDPNTGWTAEYWRLLAYTVDLATATIKVSLGGYLSEQVRRDGKQPAVRFTRDLGIDGINLSGNMPEQIYKALKALQPQALPNGKQAEADFFSDAKDLI